MKKGNYKITARGIESGMILAEWFEDDYDDAVSVYEVCVDNYASNGWYSVIITLSKRDDFDDGYIYRLDRFAVIVKE